LNPVDRSYYMYKIFLINTLAFLWSLAIFFDDPADLMGRMGTTITLFLASVAFLFVVNDKLPKVSYLTILDKLILVSFVLLFAVAAESLFVYTLACEDDRWVVVPLNITSLWAVHPQPPHGSAWSHYTAPTAPHGGGTDMRRLLRSPRQRNARPPAPHVPTPHSSLHFPGSQVVRRGQAPAGQPRGHVRPARLPWHLSRLLQRLRVTRAAAAQVQASSGFEEGRHNASDARIPGGLGPGGRGCQGGRGGGRQACQRLSRRGAFMCTHLE
jgi:hypothetical protein